MSSAILYIGIVAIWAFVLVPRWLRRDHEQPETASDTDADAEVGAELAADHRDEPDLADGDGNRPDGNRPASSRSGARTELPTPSRSGVMQARRRILTMLLAMTGGAVACFMLKLTPWWAIVPPVGMLSLFLLILREATRAEAEQARRRPVQDGRIRGAGRPARSVSRAKVITFEEPELSGPSAEVIDISTRVGDQLYDQYADATIRAVGD